MKNKTINIETLIAMFVIAMGENVGAAFCYKPKLPYCFAKGINLVKHGMPNAYLVQLSAAIDGSLTCWFLDDDEERATCITLDEVKLYCPYLYVAILTHVFDMIENIKEC